MVVGRGDDCADDAASTLLGTLRLLRGHLVNRAPPTPWECSADEWKE